MEIQTELMAGMLKQVYLGKTIEECVMLSTDKILRVVAIDKTSSIVLNVSAPVSIGNNITLGIGDISTLIKYLDSLENGVAAVTVQDNRMVFTSGKTNFRYLLTAPDNIGTQMEDPPLDGSDFTEIMNMPYVVGLTPEIIQQFNKTANLIKPKAVTFKLGSRGRVTLDAGMESEHKFDMVLGLCKSTETPFVATQLIVFGEHLMRILGALVDGVEASLHMAEDASTLVVVQNENYWAMQPLSAV